MNTLMTPIEDIGQTLESATPQLGLMEPEKLDALHRFAGIMSTGVATVPKHLQGNVADCLAVSMQAARWGMDPFAVAQKTHIVNGALGYEAQLVHAVLQTSGAINGRLKAGFAHLHVTVDIFQYNNRVIDHHSDSESHACQ